MAAASQLLNSLRWFNLFSATAVYLFKVYSVLIMLQAKKMSVPGKRSSLKWGKIKSVAVLESVLPLTFAFGIHIWYFVIKSLWKVPVALVRFVYVCMRWFAWWFQSYKRPVLLASKVSVLQRGCLKILFICYYSGPGRYPQYSGIQRRK